MGFKLNEKTGKWEAWFIKRHPDTGKPVIIRRTGLKSENEAKKVEKNLVLFVDEKIQKQIIPAWGEVVSAYLENCKKRGLAEKSIYNMGHCLRAATSPKFWLRRIDRITTEDVFDIVMVDHKDYSDHHKKTLFNFMRGTFSYAVESNWIQRNPTPKLSFRCKTKMKKVLTEEQAKFLLDKALELEWEWYPHYAIAIYTGMRNGELFALRWDKVNLKNRQMLVDEAWNNKDGFKSTKSGDDRIVEIAPNLVPIIERLKLTTYKTGFVLPRLVRWGKGEQARELGMFLQGIGLPVIRFHDLRATWATLMMSKGVEPIKVMIMGGWKELKTMQIYMRKAGVDIRGITDRLDFHTSTVKTAQVLDLAASRGR